MVKITFEKSAGMEVLKMLELDHDPKCHYCGVDIAEENLGGIFTNPTRVYCTTLPCLMKSIPFHAH